MKWIGAATIPNAAGGNIALTTSLLNTITGVNRRSSIGKVRRIDLTKLRSGNEDGD